jgi:hypothetical protein
MRRNHRSISASGTKILIVPPPAVAAARTPPQNGEYPMLP